MGVDIASLVLAVDSTQVDKGSASLDKLAASAVKAETAGSQMIKATERQVALHGKSSADALRYDASLLKLNSTERDRIEGLAKAIEKQEASDLLMQQNAATAKYLAVALVAAATASVALFKATVDAADAMNDMHLRTGLAFKELAAYDILARQSGSTVEGVAQGFKFLGKNIIENSAELAALGVTSKDTKVAMGQFADLIASINDPALKSTLAMKYLGRAGVELIPTLSGGSAAFDKAMKDSKAYGEALEKAAPAADAFNDEMAKLSIRVTAAAQELAIKFLPLLTTLAQDATAAGDELGSLDSSFDPLLEAFRAAVILGGNVAFVFRAIGTEAGGIAAQLAAFASGNFAGAKAIGDMMKEDAAKARAEFDAWEKKIFNLGKDGSPAGPAAAAPKKKTPEEEEQIRTAEERAKAAKKAAEEYAALVKASESFMVSLKKEADTYGMSESQKKLYEATTISLTLHKGKERDAFMASATAAIADKQAKEDASAAARIHNDTVTKFFEEEEKAQKKINDGITSLREQTEAIEENAAKLLLTGNELRKHIVLRAMEKSGLEASSLAYKEMKDRLNEALMNEEVAKKTKEVADKATEFAKQAASNIQDAFADGLFDIMEGKFDDLGKSFTTMLNRMVANAMAANLGKYLLGDVGKTGDIGGVIGKFLGAGGPPAGNNPDEGPGAGIIGTLMSFLPRFDVGTDFVPQTMPAVVHQGEKITPASKNTAAPETKPPLVVNMTFMVPAPTDKRSQEQVAAAAGTAIQRALMRNT